MAKKYLYRLTPKAIELGVDSLPPRQTILKRIVMALIDATLLDESSLRSISSTWKKSIETLDEMGWIEKEEITLDDKAYRQAPIPSLNEEQQKAFDEISKTNKTFAAWLLYGITGSGKTEVYIRLIEEALKIIQQKHDAKVNIKTTRSLPYADYIKVYNNAHIVLDQVYSYDQGYNALEAMAKGKVVFTGAEQEWLNHYDLKEDSVAINALPNAESIAEKLEWLILNPDKIEDISKNARAFIEKEHDYIKIAQKYVGLWEQD